MAASQCVIAACVTRSDDTRLGPMTSSLLLSDCSWRVIDSGVDTLLRFLKGSPLCLWFILIEGSTVSESETSCCLVICRTLKGSLKKKKKTSRLLPCFCGHWKCRSFKGSFRMLDQKRVLQAFLRFLGIVKGNSFLKSFYLEPFFLCSMYRIIHRTIKHSLRRTNCSMVYSWKM